ncbi:MAG TPA: tRNA (guanosine(37)-N1)-methyltransferase TrmD [Cyclobacteriaceae bacterium]|nr:tRNA (guanosine(37)-N1)-methyltransferase TrmD [Cyclobacteriaceae bacterium]
MRIDILTTLPGLLEGPFEESIVKRAREKEIVKIVIHNLRDYSPGKHKKTDDYPYGGGSGMVMMIEPVANCIGALKNKLHYNEVIYVSPDGEQFSQNIANELSLLENIIILCGHYKGVDERIRENLITREISLGDYVISGGELAAAVITDSLVRLLPGALNDESSALSDSFQDSLIAAPVYTRPETFGQWKVPEVLLSGNQKKIEEWRMEKSLERTKERRPELYKVWSERENKNT